MFASLSLPTFPPLSTSYRTVSAFLRSPVFVLRSSHFFVIHIVFYAKKVSMSMGMA